MRTTIWIGVAGVAVMMACSDDPVTAPGPMPPLATLFSATGRVGATVNQFRALLGPVNGGIAGEQPAGRREINWDRAAAIPFKNRNDFRADFFNTTVKAGAVFTTPGTDEGGFSFVGVTFADPIIARVRITLGTGALGAGVDDVSAGGTVDLVVLDNLIYGEPHKAL